MIEGLTDKVVIVTGGAHGIGKAYCSAFTQAGARVVIADIDKHGAETTASEISNAARAAGDRSSALPLYVDVSNEAATKEMTARTVDRFGRIDVLINNA
ncbi:MAG TPA: SDR family NAD(P)-dependent oxidoreductase, partial [Candidatus Binatia bacterium]